MRTSFDTDKIQTSLTALGVTLLGAASAQAGEIYVGTDVTETNGIASASFTLALPGADTFVIQAEHSTTHHGKIARFISIKELGTYGKIKTVANGRWSVLVPAASGQKWSAMAGANAASGTLAGNTSLRSAKAYAAHYNDAYFGFTFKDTTHANQLDYGWIALTLVHDGYNSLDVLIQGYAWEPDGAQLAAGAAPSDAPEPASGPLGATAVAAMMLGAAGVRRWKAARQSQVN